MLLNSLPLQVAAKLYTRRQSGFVNYAKQSFVNEYTSNTRVCRYGGPMAAQPAVAQPMATHLAAAQPMVTHSAVAQPTAAHPRAAPTTQDWVAVVKRQRKRKPTTTVSDAQRSKVTTSRREARGLVIGH